MEERMSYKPPSFFSDKISFSTRWISERARNGDIPGTVKVGSRYRIDEDKFWKWWKSHEVIPWRVPNKLSGYSKKLSDIPVRIKDDSLGRLLGITSN